MYTIVTTKVCMMVSILFRRKGREPEIHLSCFSVAALWAWLTRAQGDPLISARPMRSQRSLFGPNTRGRRGPHYGPAHEGPRGPIRAQRMRAEAKPLGPKGGAQGPGPQGPRGTHMGPPPRAQWVPQGTGSWGPTSARPIRAQGGTLGPGP